MGEGFPFLDIVLFAMVAAFIILRLRGVLGRRPGNGRTNHDALSSSQKSDEKVIKLPDRAQEPSDDYGEEVKTEEEAVVEIGHPAQ